ncbi:hypothetical protein A4G99_06510 [Haladaptatus sp. R4]|uniref:hypothetical protein n=1 Tax=Haladaptatus sp. R4 TaxID=1679489 RepID=UPI0007B47966|nr:hypothetical protein [Haladaptatus sp. R4]KZN24101.1 hypothetical protein A4G99_06510 [Haladaptatus sp. R4]
MATDEREHGGIMFGRSTRLSKRLLAVAVGIFALTFLAHTPPDLFPITFPFGLDLRILFLLAVVPPLVAVYWNDGLLVSLVLAAAPTVGFFVPLAAFDLVYPSSSLAWGIETGVAAALVLGVPAYLVGSIARRIVSPP